MGKILLLITVCAVLTVDSFPYPGSERSNTYPYQSGGNDSRTYEQINAQQGGPPVVYSSSNSNPQSGISQNENTNRTVRETKTNDQNPSDQYPLDGTKAPSQSPSTTLGDNSPNNQNKDTKNQQSTPEILLSSEQRTSSSVSSTSEDSKDRNGSEIQQKNTDESDGPLSPTNTRNRRDDSEKENNSTTGEPDDVRIIKLPSQEE